MSRPSGLLKRHPFPPLGPGGPSWRNWASGTATRWSLAPLPHPWQTWGYLIFWVVLDEMHILNLAVHPDHRRRSIAQRLLAEGLAQARTLGAELAWLEVRPSNLAALALYESFGFKEVGRRPRYYDDTQEDALLLTLDWSEAEINGRGSG